MSVLSNLAMQAGEAGGSFIRELRKASGMKDGRRSADGPISTFVDPYSSMTGMGYREHHLGTFDILRRTRDELPPVGAVLATRTAQVLTFSKPARNKFDTGFRICVRDDKKHPTPAQLRQIEALTRFIEHTGVDEGFENRDSFTAYLSKVVGDALLYAQDATEIVRDKKGVPSSFYAVDASTIRLADLARGAQPSARVVGGETKKDAKYVQVVDGVIRAAYGREDLIFGIQNPTSDIRYHGYGVSNLERCMHVCAAMLNVWTYNNRMWSGVQSRGVFNLKGATDRMVDDFRMRMGQWMKGVENAFSTPVVSLDDGLEWIDLGKTLNDMQFSQWWSVLLRLLCAYYLIAPDEVNFSMSDMGVTSTLAAPGAESNKYKIIESRERGLVPLLQHFASNINANIIHPMTEDFTFEFVGLDAMTREERVQYNASRLNVSHTFNEIRAEEDQKPLPDELGNILGNPIYLQNKLSVAQAAQQQAFQESQQPPTGQDGGVDEEPEATQNDAKPDANPIKDAPEELQRSQRWVLET